MEDVFALERHRPLRRSVGVAAGGEVAVIDDILGDAAKEMRTLESCVMTVELSANVDDGASRRKRRCRRKRKAGEHHRAPPSALDTPPVDSGVDRTTKRQNRNSWKPYTAMTWEERRAKDELEDKRAARRRDRRLASGQAIAPYNTTQFLMEQYDVDAPVGREFFDVTAAVIVRRPQTIARTPDSSGTGGGESSTSALDDIIAEKIFDDDEDRSVREELFFLQREFNEAYSRQHAERLETMTKEELIRDYIQMEAVVERLQSRSAESAIAFPPPLALQLPVATRQSTANFEGVELRRLKAENTRLVKENDRLSRELAAVMSTKVSPSVADL